MKAHQRRARFKSQPLSGSGAEAGAAFVFHDASECIQSDLPMAGSAQALSAISQGPWLLAGEGGLLGRFRKRIIEGWTQEGLEVKPCHLGEAFECHRALAEATAREAGKAGAKGLIAFGGGKAIDLVKWAGQLAGLKVVSAPTSAATCAGLSSVVVEHDSEGRVLDLIDLASPPLLCVLDLEILRQAPPKLMAAGLADTLAKWLEWRACESEAPEAGSELEAWNAAHLAFETVKLEGEEALLDTQSLAWQRCLHANLSLSARASNLGAAPAALAHSFCAGLSLLPEARGLLHGQIVAWGLLFQAQALSLAGLDTSLGRQELENLLKCWGLDLRLPWRLSPDKAEQVLERMLQADESLHAVQGAQRLKRDLLLQALLSLEP